MHAPQLNGDFVTRSSGRSYDTRCPRLPRIAIVGAGPAGMTLARLLHTRFIPVTIFEGDASPEARKQGSTLDLHDDAGLAALRRGGLEGAFLEHARADGDGMRICDKEGRMWLRLPSSSEKTWYSRALAQGKPEIDRGWLQTILRESLPDGCIQWGKKLKTYDTATRTLHFADGSADDSYDLVVGAEGGWSKVRNALTDIRPQYSGFGGFAFSVPDADAQMPNIARLVNRGGWFNYGGGRKIVAQQMGDGSLYVISFALEPEDWQQKAGYDVNDGVAVRQALLNTYKDWVPEVRQLILHLDPASVSPRNLYMMPPDFEWKHTRGATLIGDSVHLMPPFIGQGVNIAMRDALDLTDAILNAGTDPDLLDRNVQRFEQTMFPRSHAVKYRCKDMVWYIMYAPGAPGKTIHKWFVRNFSDDLGPVLSLVLRIILGVIYILYRNFFV